MPKVTISLVDVEVRDEREADQVKAALEHILSLDGAKGALNLFDELRSNVMARTMVTAIAKKFRKKDK